MDSPTELPVRRFLTAMYPKEKAGRWIFTVLWIIFFACGIWLLYRQKQWDDRVRDWDKVDGVITRYEIIRGKKRGSSHTELQYRYNYKGRTYDGSCIAYDLNRYPRIKVGAVRPIIVDPAAPENSAAMVYFRKNGSWIRYLNAISINTVAAIIGLVLLCLLLRRPPEIPADLTRYLATVAPGESVESNKPPRLRAFGGWVSRLPQLDAPDSCMLGTTNCFQLLLAIAFAVGACFLWRCKLIPGVVFSGLVALLLGLTAFPPRLKIDFVTRTIRRRRLPWHDDNDSGQTLSFSAIRRLELIPVALGKQGMIAILAAVTDDQVAWVLAKIPRKQVAALLRFLPGLATKLGYLPVVFRGQVTQPPYQIEPIKKILNKPL